MSLHAHVHLFHVGIVVFFQRDNGQNEIRIIPIRWKHKHIHTKPYLREEERRDAEF
jgi:hypothetical protein